MNIVLVDDDITFSNKLEADIKLYFKCLDEKINFIVLNDSFETIRDIDQFHLFQNLNQHPKKSNRFDQYPLLFQMNHLKQ